MSHGRLMTMITPTSFEKLMGLVGLWYDSKQSASPEMITALKQGFVASVLVGESDAITDHD